MDSQFGLRHCIEYPQMEFRGCCSAPGNARKLYHEIKEKERGKFMKVKDLANVLMTGSNEIFVRDGLDLTKIMVVTRFCEFNELTKNLLNSQVVGIYPVSNAECHIEISL